MLQCFEFSSLCPTPISQINVSNTQLVNIYKTVTKLPEKDCLMISEKIAHIEVSDQKVTHIPGSMDRVVFTQFMQWRIFREYRQDLENSKENLSVSGRLQVQNEY